MASTVVAPSHTQMGDLTLPHIKRVNTQLGTCELTLLGRRVLGKAGVNTLGCLVRVPLRAEMRALTLMVTILNYYHSATQDGTKDRRLGVGFDPLIHA